MSTNTLTHNEEATAGSDRVRAWLWPNIVSLDAPIIAVLWQVLLARGLRLKLNPVEPLILGLAVWAIYVSDQILDVLRPAAEGWEPARKRFYRKHVRLAALAGFCLASVVLPLAYHLLRPRTLNAGFILAVPVLCYLGLVHLAPTHWRAYWPREAVVAAVFTLGTFLGVWVVNGRHIQPLCAPAILFSVLCWVNCSAIESWEWQNSIDDAGGVPSSSARWAARHLSVIGSVIAMAAAVMGTLSVVPMEFAGAALWSGIALAGLGACRSQLRANFLRVAADAALCTPLLALVSAWVR